MPESIPIHAQMHTDGQTNNCVARSENDNNINTSNYNSNKSLLILSIEQFELLHNSRWNSCGVHVTLIERASCLKHSCVHTDQWQLI